MKNFALRLVVIVATITLSLTTLFRAEAKGRESKTIVTESYITFEAECTTSKLGDSWKIVEDRSNTKVAGSAPASNGKYIEAISGNVSGAGITAGNGVLKYKFTPKSSGVYQLTGRMAQNLEIVPMAKKWDKANDIYVKMEGDYLATEQTPVNFLNSWVKFYGRGWANNKAKWGAFMKLDAHVDGKDVKFKALYNLKGGKEYTFSISVRSKGLIIDYFLLAKQLPNFNENIDLSTISL